MGYMFLPFKQFRINNLNCLKGRNMSHVKTCLLFLLRTSNELMGYLQVKIWFQNRRMKWRNSKERELLATGGSREQTLPNKNNPNPDLSDADGDRPRMDLSDVSPLTSPQRPEEQTENEEDEEINVT